MWRGGAGEGANLQTCDANGVQVEARESGRRRVYNKVTAHAKAGKSANMSVRV